MNRLNWNDEFFMELPEGFVLMSEEDLKAAGLKTGGNILGARNQARHLLISGGWKNAGLLRMLLNEKDAEENSEREILKAMKPYGGTLSERLRREIGGLNAEGFSYGYTAQDIPMTAEMYVIKSGSTFCYFYGYYRTEGKAEGHALWNEMLDSVIHEKH